MFFGIEWLSRSLVRLCDYLVKLDQGLLAASTIQARGTKAILLLGLFVEDECEWRRSRGRPRNSWLKYGD